MSALRAFWERYPDAEQPLTAWYAETTHATWTQPADIKAQYRTASVLKNRRVVFNIKGNDYHHHPQLIGQRVGGQRQGAAVGQGDGRGGQGRHGAGRQRRLQRAGGVE